VILYDAAHAPSPRRVRMVLAEKGLQIERRTVDLRTGEHLAEAFRRINPLGTVPVLVVDDLVLTESSAICRYLDAIAPEPPLFGRTPAEIAVIEQCCRRIEEHGYRPAVDALRNRAHAFTDRALPGMSDAVPQIPALVDRAAIVFESFTRELDRRLQDTRWIAGSFFSFADIAALVAIDFAERARLTVSDGLANLAGWRAAMNGRSSASA
jgi:glutathione S-transferase